MCDAGFWLKKKKKKVTCSCVTVKCFLVRRFYILMWRCTGHFVELLLRTPMNGIQFASGSLRRIQSAGIQSSNRTLVVEFVQLKDCLKTLNEAVRHNTQSSSRVRCKPLFLILFSAHASQKGLKLCTLALSWMTKSVSSGARAYGAPDISSPIQ